MASLSYDDLTEAKKLFEAYERQGEYHDADDSVRNFLSWIEDHFTKLLAWAAQEPMAHQLADADQALTELEADMKRFPPEQTRQSLAEHVARLRTAIEGTDYAR